MIYTPTSAGSTIHSFAAWVISEMIFNNEYRATIKFNGTPVNVKSTSDPEDIVEKYYLIRKTTN